MQRRTVFIYAKEDPNTTISPKESNFITDTVTAVTVQMCRNRDLNLGTSISNLLCSARLLGLNFLCCGRGAQQGHLLSVTGSLLLKRSSCLEHMKPRHSASQQQKVLTFKWERSNAVALWPSLINWCHRKWIVSLSRVTAIVQQCVCLPSDVINVWRQRTGTETIALLRAQTWVGVNQHHQMLEILTIKDFWVGEKNWRGLFNLYHHKGFSLQLMSWCELEAA